MVGTKNVNRVGLIFCSKKMAVTRDKAKQFIVKAFCKKFEIVGVAFVFYKGVLPADFTYCTAFADF